VFTKLNNIRDGRDIHFPLIGCGLDGGNWNIVENIINEVLDDTAKNNLWVLE